MKVKIFNSNPPKFKVGDIVKHPKEDHLIMIINDPFNSHNYRLLNCATCTLVNGVKDLQKHMIENQYQLIASGENVQLLLYNEEENDHAN